MPSLRAPLTAPSCAIRHLSVTGPKGTFFSPLGRLSHALIECSSFSRCAAALPSAPGRGHVPRPPVCPRPGLTAIGQGFGEKQEHPIKSWLMPLSVARPTLNTALLLLCVSALKERCTMLDRHIKLTGSLTMRATLPSVRGHFFRPQKQPRLQARVVRCAQCQNHFCAQALPQALPMMVKKVI